MTESLPDEPAQELRSLFRANCSFLAGAGVTKIPLAHGNIGEIEVNPGSFASFSTVDYITDGQQIFGFRTDITVTNDGQMLKIQEVEYPDEEGSVPQIARERWHLSEELLSREEELASVTASDLQQAVDFLSLVVKAVVNRKALS